MKEKGGFSGKELYAIVLLCLVNFFLFADQNLMAPNLSRIASDFGMTPEQRDTMLGGQVALGFWVLGGIVTLLIGYITDKFSRKTLFIAVVLIGEIPCLLTAFAQNYWQFFILRSLTGIGLGGTIPLTYSLLGDYFRHTNRARAVGVVMVAGALGTAIGQMIAGFTSNITLGPLAGWRIPFAIVAIPGFIMIFLFWLTIKEPPRGKSEDTLRELIESGKVYASRINMRQYLSLFTIKSNIILLLEGLPGIVPWSVLQVYFNDYLSQEKGYSIETATLFIMVIGVGILIGLFLSGVMGDLIYAWKPRMLPVYVGSMVCLGIVPMVILIRYPSQAGLEHPNYVPIVLLSLFTGIIITQAAASVKSMFLNINTPETRGSIFSLFNLVDDLGRGFGPVIVSQLIVAFGRHQAILITPFFWLPCGLLFFVLYFTFPRDRDRLARVMKERAGEIA